ncbi:MAG TPA: GDP-mannose 4,6-dehydratase [Acidimicrobiia bacterium]|nr:GDP-mannose 4,6-dehydratase [Acidimicrobiia bacterium]
MRALVTGARGFVGPHLCAHLRDEGDDVVALDRADGLDVTDPDGVRTALARHIPDVVYHLAARSHVGESWADPTAVLRVNVEGTLHVVRAAHDVGASRVVVIGSAEAYGAVPPERLPITEDEPLRPTSPYGASKAAAEIVALQLFRAVGVGVVCVRPFNHVGPGQSTRFVVPALAERVARAEVSGADEITIGSTAPVRDITDVRDIVRAYRLLAIAAEPGTVANVCTGRGTAVADVLGHFLARARVPLVARTDPELVRPVEIPVSVGDPSRLVAATGWAPRFSLDETLDAVLDEARGRVSS